MEKVAPDFTVPLFKDTSTGMYMHHKLRNPQTRHKFKKYDEIGLKEIEEAYYMAAQVVEKYGDKYLPIFIRMQQELEKMKTQEKIKQEALNVAKLNK